ncbi:MAG: hypothetical protein JNM56_18445 [Planctomycetia bacterium]|nr:hypothetical protein [Planctomycetia bacterium]
MEMIPALALLLIVIGVLLLLAELFLPSGLLLVLGLVAILFGIGVPFYYGDSTTGVVALVGVVVIVPALVVFLWHWGARTWMSRRLFLHSQDEDVTVAQMPVIAELEQLRGRFGRAMSPLRPSGAVDFDGRRIDCISEGMPIEPGSWVRCIDVRTGKVVVRQVDEPKLSDLENAPF